MKEVWQLQSGVPFYQDYLGGCRNFNLTSPQGRAQFVLANVVAWGDWWLYWPLCAFRLHETITIFDEFAQNRSLAQDGYRVFAYLVGTGEFDLMTKTMLMLNKYNDAFNATQFKQQLKSVALSCDPSSFYLEKTMLAVFTASQKASCDLKCQAASGEVVINNEFGCATCVMACQLDHNSYVANTTKCVPCPPRTYTSSNSCDQKHTLSLLLISQQLTHN